MNATECVAVQYNIYVKWRYVDGLVKSCANTENNELDCKCCKLNTPIYLLAGYVDKLFHKKDATFFSPTGISTNYRSSYAASLEWTGQCTSSLCCKRLLDRLKIIIGMNLQRLKNFPFFVLKTLLVKFVSVYCVGLGATNESKIVYIYNLIFYIIMHTLKRKKIIQK